MPAATLTAAEAAKQGAPTASTDLAVIKTQQPAAWSVHLPGGERVTVRAARPGDAEMLQAYVRELSVSARYNRFFGPLRELPPAELTRMTHMNQPSRATLIAEIGGSEPVMIGELRYALLSDAACEFAISVAEGWRGKGIGSLMLGDLQWRVRALGASGRQRKTSPGVHDPKAVPADCIGVQRDERQNIDEHLSRHRDLGQWEGDVAIMPDELRAMLRRAPTHSIFV
jgi:GNAT superfamily N-acetyltransferase